MLALSDHELIFGRFGLRPRRRWEKTLLFALLVPSAQGVTRRKVNPIHVKSMTQLARISIPYRPLDGEGPDEPALIEAARTDADAFGELCGRYSTRLYGYLRARTNSDDDAADLTQQVFAKAMAALPAYQIAALRLGPGSFGSLAIC